VSQAGQLQEIIPKDNHDLSIRYYNELIYKFVAQGKLDSANQYLSTLLEQSYKYNDIHINAQVDILLTKARLEIINKKLEAAENTIEKLSYIVGSNNFETVYDAKRYQGELEYLRGHLEVQVMGSQRDEIKKKRIALAEGSLTTALAIFTNLPESNGNTVKIINTYLARADLASLKEDYPEAKRSLESADILLN
jgi:tetratricopeptide (TPR) repeat protein